MLASIALSKYWMNALAPPADKAPPKVVINNMTGENPFPSAAITIAVIVVNSRSKTIRGFVNCR
jgi:hypothetical protein